MFILKLFGIALYVLSANVYADYDCLCNYLVEIAMHGAPNENSSPVGYMYEFDCKPAVSANELEETWIAIMNEHLTAYVKKESGLQMQVCAGSLPDEDKLFTSTKQTTSTTTTRKPTTTSTTTTTTPKQTTTSTTTTTTPKPTTTSTTTTTTPKPTTTSTTTTVTTTPKPTTTSTTTTVTTTPKPIITSTTTTTPKLTTISTTTTTQKPTTTIKPSEPTTTATTDTYSTTERTKQPPVTISRWSSTSDWLIRWNITHAPYTTMKPHHTTHRHNANSYPATKKQYHTTDWLIHWNITHSPFTSAQPHFTQGDLNLCPGALRRSTAAKWLRQYKSHCYELVHISKNWHSAENDCWNRLGHGGELLEIYTEDIQNYIMNFLHEIGNHRFIWIGLQDIVREEHFTWDSGAKVTYSNWSPTRKNNNLHHKYEDCVMLRYNGLWDDTLCSTNDIHRRFLVNANITNVRRPYICQYPTHTPHHG